MVPARTTDAPRRLVIVESPAKARTIQGYLGSGYDVHASIGHIRDLPNSAAQVPAAIKDKPWGRLAIDVDDAKLALATSLGAEVAINARTVDVVESVQEATGGVHGVLVTAVHPQAFGQAIGLTRRGGTIVFNGLPPGDFPAPIFDIVLKGLTIRGSIVGTRQDMAEALDFYARGLIKPTVTSARLDDINDVFERMEHGQIDGRIVIDYRNA